MRPLPFRPALAQDPVAAVARDSSVDDDWAVIVIAMAKICLTKVLSQSSPNGWVAHFQQGSRRAEPTLAHLGWLRGQSGPPYLHQPIRFCFFLLVLILQSLCKT